MTESGTATVTYWEGEESWAVETTFPQEGNTGGFKTKEDAVDYARDIVGYDGDQLVIEKKNGDVQDIHNY